MVNIVSIKTNSQVMMFSTLHADMTVKFLARKTMKILNFNNFTAIDNRWLSGL